jgi:hypothetical protein
MKGRRTFLELDGFLKDFGGGPALTPSFQKIGGEGDTHKTANGPNRETANASVQPAQSPGKAIFHTDSRVSILAS